MDLVYIPELFTYGYLRNPQYHDYEQPWNRDYFKCDRSKSRTFSLPRKSVENQRTVQQLSKENCHFCKEMKRRNLAVYIRSKSRSDSCHEGIQEEEENDVMYNERKIVNADRNKSAKSSCNAEKS
ncbi:hypothetical protein ALC56_02802 [Trachymyrmex septentrionalis]|uniref:Uncharacterized protein n=1 Tax=Trachymyrmex septentrionalis TaxID=34720 RepID=A0A195FRT2_9HYME|nr:hypothetical protein ALC56_02802 [Trachymyrmex septentrionalis]